MHDETSHRHCPSTNSLLDPSILFFVFGLLAGAVVPALGYLLLRRLLNGFDAAAVAATYGSVSAVTFISAVPYTEAHGLAPGGHIGRGDALMARNAVPLRRMPPALLVYALGGPLLHAALALAAAVGLSAGNGALLMVLAASASYIAVPAVLRQAIPEAQPALYFGMSLGLTFPFNILLGIPLYTALAQRVLAAPA